LEGEKRQHQVRPNQQKLYHGRSGSPVMKRVEDMSVEEMEGYFKHVDKIVKIFGKSYRIFWPFNIFSPFSPTRIILNFGVLFTWIYIL